jgi:TPP-dependent 2-oxoacid decarboxylase
LAITWRTAWLARGLTVFSGVPGDYTLMLLDHLVARPGLA